MDTNDLVGNIIAGLALLVAIGLGIWGNLRDKENEKRTLAVVDSLHATNTRLAEVLLELAARPEGSAVEQEVDRVEWEAQQVSKNTWLVRNQGREAATSVTIDREALGGVRIDTTPRLPSAIGPGESLKITALGAWGAPVANELKISWGSGRAATVPLSQL